MLTLLAFVVTILVIVAVHELGHYLSMRAFGIHVLTFSVGFGPRLLGWRNRAGTDFIISAIPLGGYVRPLDCRDTEVAADQRHAEFSGRPPWQRILTYAAGPAANLLLAVLVYWVVLASGQTGMAPAIGEVHPQSAAAAAGLAHGDEIIAVEDRQTRTWQQVGAAMMRYVGEDRALLLTVQDSTGSRRQVPIQIGAWSSDPEQPALPRLGIVPMAGLPVLGEVLADSPAFQAGLQPGDRVLAVDGQSIASWGEWVEQVRAHPGESLVLDIERSGRTLSLTLIPERVTQAGEEHGRAGVMMAGLRSMDYGMGGALVAATARVLDQSTMILASLAKMITGDLSWKTIGGPITIAQVAGETAAMGLMTFLLFLGFFSVSLGIINLLPVPMLDGGWIVFGVLEMVRRKALSERFLAMAQSLGMTLVLGLMFLAIFNDVMRQLS